MSHRHSVIELSSGLTALVGPNNCGKSAVVTALKILAHNDVSTYVKRHGEKECRVKVELVDDEQQVHTIEWSRKNSPQYTIDGKSYDRLRNAGLPPMLAELLKLPIVQGEGGNEFDIHFGEQKSPVFLLDKSASQTAQFFASSSDAAHLVAMQKLHLRKVSEAKASVARLNQQELQVRAELEKLEPAMVLQHQLRELEQIAAQINISEQRAAGLRDMIGALSKSEENRRRLNMLADCLCELPQLPELTDVSLLQRLVADLPRQSHNTLMLQRQSQAISELASPPLLAETNRLKGSVEALVIGELQTRALARRLESLADLPSLPELADTAGLRVVCQTMKTCDAEFSRLRAEHQQTVEAIRSLNDEWKTLRRDMPACPTCGQDLPADFLHDHQHEQSRHDAEHELPRARSRVVQPETASKRGDE